MTKEGDIVLIYYQDKPTLYARIEAIEFDIKKDWYQVTLLLLSIPIQMVTWILREEYINGTVFTMKVIKTQPPPKIDSPLVQKKKASPESDKDTAATQERGKVIEFKKKDKD